MTIIMKFPSNLHSLTSPATTTLLPLQIKPQNLSLSSAPPPSSNITSSPSPSLTRFNYNLGKKWMEYQGVSNWDNLLDPLDNNLRSEILRYGDFVEAAYKSYDSKKNKLTDICNYKVTKHLRATSGINLPPWVATRSSNIGYIAVCDDEQEIERLGRLDVVIAFRGTITFLEWLENLRTNLTHIKKRNNGGGAMVQSGFLSLYTSAGDSDDDNSLSLQQMVREEIHRILRTYGGQTLSLTFTGHSLGAALATLTAYDVKAAFGSGDRMVTVMSFGGPRVGDRRFTEEAEGKGVKVLRIVNSEDVITKVPGFVFDDVAGGRGVHVARWVKERLEDAKWTYAEVGKELRVCSKDSPYLRGMDVATCHDLSTYLHLIDGFVSSTCPFKATAKRFLRR